MRLFGLKHYYLKLIIYGTLLLPPLFGLNHFDEIITAINLLICLYNLFLRRVTHDYLKIWLGILIFTLTGVIGNILWKYQPLYYVLGDIVDNIKIFVNFFAVIFLLRKEDPLKLRAKVKRHYQYVIYILFIELIISAANQFFFHFNDWNVRSLFYNIPTLCGIIGTLFVVSITLYGKNDLFNRLFLSFLLLMMFKVKAYLLLMIFCFIYFICIKEVKKLRLRHLLIVAPLVVEIAWERIKIYYLDMNATWERTVLTRYSLRILKDYFPIGTGFGTYCSSMSVKRYSPVYLLYGFEYMWNLGPDSTVGVMTDVFWPMIAGQTGILGLILYTSILILIYKNIIKPLCKKNILQYAGCLVIFIYLFLDSFGESSYSNLVGWIMGFALGLSVVFNFKIDNDELLIH